MSRHRAVAEPPYLTHWLSAADSQQIRALLDQARASGLCEDKALFQTQATVLAQELPRTLRALLRDFITRDQTPALLMRGNPIDPSALPRTPADHEQSPVRSLNDAELLCGLYMSLTGDLFGYSSQHSGSIFNDIIAVPSQADIHNSSAGSTFAFDFHTEDAFHPFPPDYLGLVCIRNEEQAVTRIAWLPPDALPAMTVATLMKSAIPMFPNAVHAQGGATTSGRYAVLSGDPRAPYIRLNLNTIERGSLPQALVEHIDTLVAVLRGTSASVTLAPGDFLLMNNRIALHRRDAYAPRYDRNGRWLIRVVSMLDIRRTRHLRSDAIDRIVSA